MNNPCGCSVVVNLDTKTSLKVTDYALNYCPLHLNAPAMLEALKKLVRCVESDSYLCKACNETVKAAIRAAEGNSNA